MRLSKHGRKICDKLLSLHILVKSLNTTNMLSTNMLLYFFYFVSILYSVGFVCLDFVCLGNQSLRVARLVTSKVSIGIRATSMDSRDVDNLVEKSSILRR